MFLEPTRLAAIRSPSLAHNPPRSSKQLRPQLHFKGSDEFAAVIHRLISLPKRELDKETSFTDQVQPFSTILLPALEASTVVFPHKELLSKSDRRLQTRRQSVVESCRIAGPGQSSSNHADSAGVDDYEAGGGYEGRGKAVGRW